MLKNRSVPTDTLRPHIICRDVAEAIAWLTQGVRIRSPVNKPSPLPIPANSRMVGKQEVIYDQSVGCTLLAAVDNRKRSQEARSDRPHARPLPDQCRDRAGGMGEVYCARYET